MAQIALGVTGSVAAIRAPLLVEALRLAGHDARVVATEPSLYFFDPAALPTPSVDAGLPLGRAALYRDADEWPRRLASAENLEPSLAPSPPRPLAPSHPWGVFQREDPVLHIELRRWADLLLIAPLDANTLAKLAYGLSDNLLTCLYRAWDPDRPILLAPAMNTFMWESLLTRRHFRLLLEQHAGLVGTDLAPDVSLDDLMAAINTCCPHLRICPPQSKRLACGDEGMGAMADVDAIVAAAVAALRMVG